MQYLHFVKALHRLFCFMTLLVLSGSEGCHQQHPQNRYVCLNAEGGAGVGSLMRTGAVGSVGVFLEPGSAPSNVKPDVWDTDVLLTLSSSPWPCTAGSVSCTGDNAGYWSSSLPCCEKAPSSASFSIGRSFPSPPSTQHPVATTDDRSHRCCPREAKLLSHAAGDTGRGRWGPCVTRQPKWPLGGTTAAAPS